jgi:hypothetical protein
MNKEWIIHGFLVFLLLSLIIAIPGAATSTEVRVVKFASDGYTILNETTVDFRWMEQNLPVQGDGSTHYYLQGPVFADNPEDRWNPAEDTNVQEKDMGAVKGTNIRDLCDLVGGMAPEDELVVKATDGFSRTFAYDNIYSPPPRQGPVILAWYRGDTGYVPTYAEGMRLLFLADTSDNPWGIHAMGVWDWHESAAEQYWYYYYNGNERYPTTTGLSVQSVGELQIFSQEEPTGVINVTSQPDGGRIYLDDEDTGELTPASITGVPVGTHSVRVEKEGYEVPDEAWVDVAYGQVAEAPFDLMQIPAVSSEGSGDSEEADAQGKESGLSGSELGFFAENSLQGTISLAEIPGMNGSWKDGVERPFTIPGLPDQGISFGRLYVFTANCSDIPSPLKEDSRFILEIKGRLIGPDRVYRDEGIDGAVITYAYNITGITDRDSGETLRRESLPGSSCTVEGVVVLMAVQNDTAPPISFRVHEGADLIASSPGQPLIDGGTTTEFDMDNSGEPYTRANLTFICTGMTDDPAPRFQVQVNGETISGTFPPSADPVHIAGVSFKPPQSGSPVVTSIQALINQTNGLYGETRVAVFTFTGANISNPDQSAQYENKSAELEQNQRPLATSPPVTNGESVQSQHTPAPANIHEPPGTGPIRWVTDIFDAITTFILTLFGEPVPAIATGTAAPTPGSGNQSIADTTDASQPGTGGELQGYSEVKDNGSALSFAADDEHSGVDEKSQDNTLSATTGTPVSHHGGVYITSYPADVELRIDNKVITRHLPAVIYGVREGIHSIEVRLRSDDNRIIGSQSSRVWIYPDAITTAHFDLVRPDIKQQVHVSTSDGTNVSFTLNGYYPLQRTPADIEFTGTDPFISVTHDGSYLSYTLSARVINAGEMVIPSETPPMYRLPVESSPSGAEVIVDGIRTGYRTPAVVPNLSAGLHRIIVSFPRYEPGEEVVSVPVNDEPIVAEPVRFTLESYPCGSLMIESTPPGGTIYLDGILAGEKTPYLFTGIPLGIHEVTLRRNGENRKIDVVVKPDEIQRYVVVFKGNGTEDAV